jgi:hypothetical protein
MIQHGWIAVALSVALAGCASGTGTTVPRTSAPPAPSEPSPTPTIQDIMELEPFVPLEPGTYFIDPDGDPSTPLRVVYEVPAELLPSARLWSRLCWPSQPARPVPDQCQGFSPGQRFAHACTSYCSKLGRVRPRQAERGSPSPRRSGGHAAWSRRAARRSRRGGQFVASASFPTRLAAGVAASPRRDVLGLAKPLVNWRARRASIPRSPP